MLRNVSSRCENFNKLDPNSSIKQWRIRFPAASVLPQNNKLHETKETWALVVRSFPLDPPM